MVSGRGGGLHHCLLTEWSACWVGLVSLPGVLAGDITPDLACPAVWLEGYVPPSPCDSCEEGLEPLGVQGWPVARIPQETTFAAKL